MNIIRGTFSVLGLVLVGIGIWVAATSWNCLWVNPGQVSLERIAPLLGIFVSVLGLGVIAVAGFSLSVWRRR